MLRKIALIAVILLAVTSAAGLGVYLWLRTSLPQTSGTLVVEGPKAPVKVVRDENAVPHIFAQSEEDAYYALGFVHAQDRLWQMEFTRRLGAGRLAEVLGERALKFDRFLRTLSLYELAERTYGQLSPAARRAFDAYAAGVNAWLDTRDGALPLEFVLLGLEPEPWHPADSLVWGRLMALRLGRNWRTEALRARIAGLLQKKGLPAEYLGELWPDRPRLGPSTLDAAIKSAGLAGHLLAAIPTQEVTGGSSNAWVLDGSRTVTGKPLLANDPHLSFSAPMIWYLARLQAPGLAVTGVTLPGSPLTVLGHNGRIAWAFTNGYGDNEDLFLEALDPQDPDVYLTPDGPRRFEVREETIAVKGAEPVRLTVREGRHGPIISDVSTDVAPLAAGQRAIAFSSPLFRADDGTVEALYRINRARNWAEFEQAAAGFHTPHQNLMFASVGGDIGFIAAGRIPLRTSGDGRVPVEGNGGDYDWQGFAEPDRWPKLFNPPPGRIANGNNRIVPEQFPYLITHDWPPAFRAERILEVLDAKVRHSIDDMADLHGDIVSTAARRLLPLMLRFEPRDPRQAQTHALLAGWDHEMRADRPEPLIFTAWLRQFAMALVEDELDTETADRYLKSAAYPSTDLVEAALTRAPHWCDDIGTPAREECGDTLAKALGRALSEIAAEQDTDMASWRWGAAHLATFAHRVFTGLPGLGWLADLSIESPGGDHTVNRGATRNAGFGNPLRNTDGASFRAIYDLADLDNCRFMIPAGQSGNLLSAHYRDFLERWRDGKYIRIAGSLEDLVARNAEVLTLTPSARSQSH